MDKKNNEIKNLENSDNLEKDEITLKDKEELEDYIFFKNCRKYMETFVLTRPPKSTTHEYKIIKEAVKALSPLAHPYRVARFLNIDEEIILFGIERGYIDCFKNERNCLVKVAGILPFLKKFACVMKDFHYWFRWCPMHNNTISYDKDDIRFCGIKKRFLFLFDNMDIKKWREERD